MNIFILDRDPKTAALMHNDVHVRKMIVESAQMLCTNYRLLKGVETKLPSKSGKTMQRQWVLEENDDLLYKVVHRNHPCTVWARQSRANWAWLRDLFYFLCDEYEFRFNKTHLSYTKLAEVLREVPSEVPDKPFEGFAICMDQYPECKIPGDPVASYRKYYIQQKLGFTNYTKREVPLWLKSYLSD